MSERNKRPPTPKELLKIAGVSLLQTLGVLVAYLLFFLWVSAGGLGH